MLGFAIARFSFVVELQGAKNQSGLGRCRASFLTSLQEETLCTCPKLSPDSLDSATTIYIDDKTITFSLKDF